MLEVPVTFASKSTFFDTDTTNCCAVFDGRKRYAKTCGVKEKTPDMHQKSFNSVHGISNCVGL